MPLLFTTVGVLIVASVVSLVLVSTGDDSSGTRNAAAAAAPTTSAPESIVPSGSSAATTSPAPSTSPVARMTPVASKSSQGGGTTNTPATRKPITYTVQKGDNLTVIAAWFKLHGYGDLYQANRKVIGDDPNLIRPGQRITVSSDGMTISSK